MLFSTETEKESELSLLDVEIIYKQDKFTTKFIENLLLVAYIVTLKVLFSL